MKHRKKAGGDFDCINKCLVAKEKKLPVDRDQTSAQKCYRPGYA